MQRWNSLIKRRCQLVVTAVPFCVFGAICDPSFAAEVVRDSSVQLRPNIVYILADDLGIGDVSCYNAEASWTTVHMDRLAAEGMRFLDAHSGSSVCTPTRYGILTGRYAWRTRLAEGVLSGTSAHLIDPQRLTIASFLKAHGYRTACIGKWHLGWDWMYTDGDAPQIDFSGSIVNGPSANGFDEYFCHNGSLDMPPYVYVENDHVTGLPDRTTVNRNYQQFWREGLTGVDFKHDEVLEVFTRQAIDFIHEQSNREQPFFVYLALPAPHTPILPTGVFVGRSGTNPYGDFTLQVDDTVGRVTQALADAGVSESTLMIVTSDNGCSPRAMFDELAKFGHKPSWIYRGHKADIYEGGHRIPFIVRWPQQVQAATTSTQIVCLTDLLRTCAEILNVSLPDTAGVDSISFLSTLLQLPDESKRDSIVHHSINGSFAIRMDQWKLALCPGSGGWSQPTPPKAAEMHLPDVQLFDLTADPAETTNLQAEYPKVVARLRELLSEQVQQGRSTPGDKQANDRTVWIERQSSPAVP